MSHFGRQATFLVQVTAYIILFVVYLSGKHRMNKFTDAFLLPQCSRQRTNNINKSHSFGFKCNELIISSSQSRCFQQLPMFMTDETSIESSTTDETETTDIPMPTENGGFTHTTASRAKISAANKGKTPWNKGKTRSEEVKKRIAEGVRRRNRENFLKKLEDMGLTEEEYEAQKKEDRRKRDAERRARRTEKGGYRPTEETKKKISKILKEKHAKGEIKKREYNGPFRKGFTHSEETKQKIRDSLKKKWAEDSEYATKMRKITAKNDSVSARQKISNTLKEKWKDPEFREKMLKSMKGRKSSSNATSAKSREKISLAMKKKWQDAEYRKKAMKGMEKYRDSLPPRAEKPKPATTTNGVMAVTPMRKSKVKKKKRAAKSTVVVSGATAGVKKKKKKAAKKKAAKKKAKKSTVKAVAKAKKKGPKPVAEKESKAPVQDDGDISRMREERRDLYDLLYGDEGDLEDDEDVESEESLPGVLDLDMLGQETSDDPIKNNEPKGLSSFFTGTAALDDENLDEFDPYNLDDY